MAKMTRSVRLALLPSWLLLGGVLATAPAARGAEAGGLAEFPPEVADGKAVDAFRQYWNAFDAYEDGVLKDGQKQFRQSWEEVKKSYQKDQARLSSAQLEALQRSAERYKSALADHPDADNRPFVMLNLAQIQNLIGDHLQKTDANAGTFAKSEALALLKDLEEGYKTFAYREQALYLRAVVLESLQREDEALAAWQTLAAAATGTLHGVHARVAVGDHMFSRERPGDAMRSYQRALELLPDVNADDPGYERLRIDYRLAWAAYRAGELGAVVKAAGELLTPGGHSRSAEQRQKIQQDAVELMGDALFENNVPAKIKEVLRRKELAEVCAAIGARALKRYNAAGIHAEAAALGEFLADAQPLADAAPEILQLTADSWGKLGKPQKRLAALERLALLLPAQSLWRARHRDDLAALRQAEQTAVAAAQVVAAARYDTGLASGSVHAFDSAAGFYDLLLEHAPNGDGANAWRLRRAHCQFFGGHFDEAARQYEALKTDFKVDPETLQLASYQLVLTNERRWHDAFAAAAEKGEDPLKEPHTGAAVQALEKSIDEFAARFPAQSRAVDLLLVGASANRDMERFDGAAKYWQRALVSQPSPAQRGIAVRGLVYASLKTGSAGDVVELARRFLKLEDWNALGLTIGTELRGVLSVAALDEGKRLGGAGRVYEAGLLLTQVAEDFADLPDRDHIYRDGAYMLAIAGDWARAQKTAEGYFAAGLTKNRADMTYLLARAYEYQIRLHEAAERYLELGEKFPRHSRAGSSLVRAEKLGVAEGDFALAATAAAAQGDQARREPERLAHYSQAVEYLEKDGNPTKALALAQRRLRSSKTPAERLRSQLLVARMTYRAGSEQEGLDSLVILAKQIDRAKGRVAAEDYAALAGEARVLLGDEARRQFEDFRIAERGGAVSANVAQKTHYFEDLAAQYDRAAAAGDPGWASQARFRLATAAEALADEIAAVPARADEAVTLKSQNRYNATVERLAALARKYHSTNVLVAHKDPARFTDNEWVRRSSLRLSGEGAASPDARHRELLPTAVQTTLPSQWSL